MSPRRRNYLSLRRLRLLAATLCLFICALPVYASGSDKLVVRSTISPAQRDELASRLRKITGWTNLTFNNDGSFEANLNEIVGGSKSARELLNTAISGNRRILFEDASSRKDVVFVASFRASCFPGFCPTKKFM